MLCFAFIVVVGVVTPPVIEDHTELRFCSADCPVQHPSHGAALTSAPPPARTHQTAAAVTAIAHDADTDIAPVAAPDAPRAPPSA